MFTVCPKCALTLIVTAADLRVAQGYVRCGRCSSVFNALAQLSDERAAAAAAAAHPSPEPPAELEEAEPPEEPAPPAPAGPRARVRAQAPASPVAEEQPIPADALEFNPATTDASAVFVTAPPNPEWTAATGSFKALTAAKQQPIAQERPEKREPVAVELDATLLSDIMGTGTKAPSAVAPGESAPAAMPAPAPAAMSPRPRRLGHARPASSAAIARTRGAPPLRETEPQADAVPESDALEATAAPSAAHATLPWTIGAALLALALLVQVIDHQRDVLATDARFSRPLTALYDTLGVPLMPRWDLRAYDVRQLGATVEPGSAGAITVRASIRNVGSKAQPLPLLRVTLQDRFGNRLASREVPPSDYLPRSAASPALLSVDQRVDAQLAFVDPGASAVGFELDACLPVRGGGVACANDASAR